MNTEMRNTRRKRIDDDNLLDDRSFKSPEPRRKRSKKKKPSAPPSNLSSSDPKTVEKTIEKKDSSKKEDEIGDESVSNFASIVGDDESFPGSYATTCTEKNEKKSAKSLKKSNPFYLGEVGEFVAAFEKKTTTEDFISINLKGAFDHYSISANSVLQLESDNCRRTILREGDKMTLSYQGKISNIDSDIFVIEEVVKEGTIAQLFSMENKKPFSSKLSFHRSDFVQSIKKRACLLDFAFLHGKKKMTEICLLDNALAGLDFPEENSKKPDWYERMKKLHGLWESAWADGVFFSLRFGGIWVIFEGNQVKVAIASRDTGHWHRPKLVLNLQHKPEEDDCFFKRFFFKWISLATSSHKPSSKIQSHAPSKKKCEQKDPRYQ